MNHVVFAFGGHGVGQQWGCLHSPGQQLYRCDADVLLGRDRTAKQGLPCARMQGVP